MTLQEAAHTFRWSEMHDYEQHERQNGRIVAIRGLGIWAADLRRLQELVPGLTVTELRRVEHDGDDWVRVDVVEARECVPLT